MDHPILTLTHGVRALWLPVCDSLQACLAGRPQQVRIDETLGVVGDLFARMAQVLHVGLGRGGEWRAGGQRVFMTGEFQADQVASW